MTQRPEILFPFFAQIDSLDGVGPRLAKTFEKIDIRRIKDLFFTLPNSVQKRTFCDTVQGQKLPQLLTLEVQVLRHYPSAARSRPYRIQVQDAKTTFDLTFFHAHGDYLVRQFPIGQNRIISGRVENYENRAQMAHPDFVFDPKESIDIPQCEPIYPLTQGLSQRLMGRAVFQALARVEPLAEWIDNSLIKKRKWPTWDAAIDTAHHPQDYADTVLTHPARERLAYDELFAHQLMLALVRQKMRKTKGIASKPTGDLQKIILGALGFKLTKAQTRVTKEILGDVAEPFRMNRLLQGDVGAGKTLVAFLAMAGIVEAGGQAVLMAPTEILARQHINGLAPLGEAAGIKMDILVGAESAKIRRKKLDDLKSGALQILIGTHAVFQADVEFRDLRLAVIDEQHRFGVRQRMDLSLKGRAVDILVMTATPIPRSLALAHYGDMETSVLDEKPPGRQPIKTVLINNGRLAEIVEKLRGVIAEGRQVYWVCPLVEESETLTWVAAAERFRHLSGAFGEGEVGLLHGQMKSDEKSTAMRDFTEGRTKILVATTIIEVGVDVPNASIMVVEDAQKFGLAQLHQLRGRIGRGDAESSCLLVYGDKISVNARKRLQCLRDSDDGFFIAETDMKLRGAGDLLGVQQSGLPRFRVANIEHQSHLLQAAADDAKVLLYSDPDLKEPRGQAARVLLYLMEKDKAIPLLAVG